MKSFPRDLLEINFPNAVTIGALTLADFQALATIGMLIVSTICTVLITRRKLKGRKPPQDADFNHKYGDE